MASNTSATLASLLPHASPSPISTEMAGQGTLLSTPSFKYWYAVPRLISIKVDFILSSLQKELKTLSVIPVNSWAMILFPLWDSCIPSLTSRLGVMHTDLSSRSCSKPVKPDSETGLGVLALPASSCITPCNSKEKGGHCLCSWCLNQSS